VLLLTGVRRSEAAALLWADIDFENGVLTIRHGKGDKRREVPIAGDFALAALRTWQMEQPTGYRNVFIPVKRGGSVGQDKPITGTDVYRIVKATETASGVEFKPHDCRRTFITEALAMGAPLATVQAAAGHARGETTLHYAQAVDARRARKELKLRYG
jgi:integrase/recombinase XerD